jgi:peptidoglycan hydrolase-like protein with peptidoglycan-binding domain
MLKKCIAGLLSVLIAAGLASVPAFAAPGAAAAESGITVTSVQPSDLGFSSVAATLLATSKSTSLNTLVLQFKVTAKSYYDDVNYSSNHYTYTAAELKMLAVVIDRESGSQPYACKIAIGNVVMNRVIAPGYPGETIKDVVTRPNQFSYSATATPDADSIKAAHEILDYETWAVPQNVYFFKATTSKANWGSHKYYKNFGNTAFYTDSYSGRYNGSTVPAKLYERVFKWPQYGCVPAKRVKKVQIMLNALGFKTTTDGWFGSGTKAALVKYQTKYGLTADGIAGPTTLKSLIKKYGINKFLKLK